MIKRYAFLILVTAWILGGCEAPTTPLSDDLATPSERLMVAGSATDVASKAATNRLLAQVRAATAKYHRLDVALADGYILPNDECASHPTEGAMGVHYIHPELLNLLDPSAGDAEYDLVKPEVLVYEPQKNGRMRLVAVEWVIWRAAWEREHPDENDTPEFQGTPFDQSFGERSHGLPDHYELHVWLWRHNPNGLHAMWNPKVSCEYGETHE